MSSGRQLIKKNAGDLIFYTKHFVRREQIVLHDQRIDSISQTMANVQTDRHQLNRNILTGDTRQVRPSPRDRKYRPTHFIGLRVPKGSPLIRSVDSYHKEIATMNENWASFLVPSSKLHLTLGVLTLTDPTTQVPQVAAVLDAAASCIRHIRLRFCGLGTFGEGRVIFARPSADEDFYSLTKLASALQHELHRKNINIRSNPNDTYTPHVTLAKVTPRISEALQAKVFPPKMYALAKYDEMGAVYFCNMQLCSMTDAHEDGYWKIHHQSIFHGGTSL